MELEDCCRGLESLKVTERAKSIKQILSLLQNAKILKSIKDGDTNSWDNIIFSTYICLMKDSEKYTEDIRKKNSSTVAYELNGKTFFDVVVIAIREDKDLNYSKLLDYVKSFLERNTMKKLYGKMCLVTMKSHILLSSRFRSNLESSDWKELLSLLKKSCENPEILQSNNYTQVECLSLVIKWGPLYSLPPDILREEFNFIMDVCKSVRKSSLRPHKEIILTLVYEFCKHIAKDNRLVCCKLGEELLLYFMELYEINIREDKLKVQLIDFYLLQVILHHPKGVPESHPASYACDWKIWNNYLRSIYWQLCKEIDYNMTCRNKNSVLFVTNVHNRQELSENFLNLIIEIGKQVLNKVDQDVSTASVVTNSSDNSDTKRQKSEISLRGLIENVPKTKNWPWIQIIYSLLNIYPETIDEHDYIFLLETIRSLQKECHDQDLRYHIYQCLNILKQIEPPSINTSTGSAVSITWNAIAEITLKEIGLHLCSDVAENLLHLLLSDGNVQNENMLKMLCSSLNFTSSCIKSVYLYGKIYDFPRSENNKIKIDIIDNILSRDDLDRIDYYAEGLTAKVLFNLILKHWFSQDNLPRSNIPGERPYNDISDIYFKTGFEDPLISFQTQQEVSKSSQIPLVDIELKEHLLSDLSQIVRKVIDNVDVELDIVLNILILLKNITNQFAIHHVLTDERTKLLTLMKFLLNHFTQIFSKSSNNTDESMAKKTLNLRLLYRVFDENEDSFALSEFISSISEELLKALFEILNENASRRYNSLKDIKFQLTLQTMKVISAYSFVFPETGRNQMQKHAFEALVTFEYDLEHEYEYILASSFLSTFRKCKLGSFDEDTLGSLLNFIKEICTVRYRIYDTACEMIETLKLILSHLKVNFSENNLKYTVDLLEPFYSRRSNYGPEISKLIVECFDVLCQIERQHGFFKNWIGDEKIIVVICEFLCNDYQEVRFSAIKSIAKFYSSENPTAVVVQKEMFKKIFQLSLQVFEIQGNISEERQIDETVSRSASVLQSFAALAMSNVIWMQESVFASIRITHMKKLNALEKVMRLLAKHFKTKNQIELLENNFDYILNRWEDFKYSLDSFPFNLFNCSDKAKFCQKYAQNIIHFLIKHRDENTLKLISQATNKDMSTLLLEYAPKIFSYVIISEGINNLQTICTKSELLTKLISVSGIDVFKQTIKDNLDSVLFELLINIHDEPHFEKHFDMVAVFSVSCGKNLTVKQFETFLKFVESNICDVDNILDYLMQHEPNKLHELTLKLKLKLHQTVVDNIKIFHGYFIIILLITKELKEKFPYHDYFIRDTVMYLLNLMLNPTVDEKLSLLASQTFYVFIKNILPTFSNNISPFFHIIVNKLTYLSTYSEILSENCINALKILIIENTNKFSANIEILDPFPSGRRFEELRKVYLDIRKQNRNISLEKEIKYFLRCGQETKFSDLREEGLKHLLKQLTMRKQELYELQSQLIETRGFSEDCEKSILHQLIVMLSKLAKSKNSNVAIGASRCLGELGALNLNTLILKPEKQIESHNLTPSEFLCGQIISHLTHYITDQDINLVAASSEALYHVLSNKEARKMSKSNEGFINGEISLNYLSPFILSTKAKADFQIRIDENALITSLNDDNLWCPTVIISHENWIKRLVSCLLETFSEKCFLSKLTQICQHKVEFCEEMLPYVIYLILTKSKEQINDFIICKINFFFEMHWKKAVLQISEHGGSTAMNISSLKSMLNCVHYIRLQTIDAASQRNNKNSVDLNLNYLHLAQAAQYCSKHFDAILYAEVWCQLKFQEMIDSFPKAQQKQLLNSKMLTAVYENVDAQTSRALEDILRGSYKTLGELDALHGCGTTIFLDPSRRIEHYKDLGKWDHALLHYEIELSHTPSSANSSKSLVESLKHCSLYKLPVLSNNIAQPEYECLWRLGQWNTDDFKDNRKSSVIHQNEFEKYRYLALKFLHEKDVYNLEKTINDGMLHEIGKIKHVSLESYHNLHGILSELQSLREIEMFIQTKTSDDIDALVETWHKKDAYMVDNFSCIEPIKSQRILMLKDKFDTLNHKKALVDLTLNLVQYSRLENHLNAATRTLNNLRFCKNLSAEAQCHIQFEDAQLCWALNDKTGAHHLLRELYNNDQTDPRVRSCSLKLAGKWFIESLSENKNTIITDYLLASLNIYKDLQDRNTQDVENIHDAYDELGRFADKEYQQIMSHMNSDMFQQKIRNMEKLKQAASDLRSGIGRRKLTIDETKAVRTHEQQSAIDEREIENAKIEKDMFLKLALKYHLFNLIYTDKNNNRIFRVISLFFENRFNQSITEIVKTYIPKIPTYKYITMLPQIVPHLSNNNENIFVEHINKIIENCVRDHPHHTLPLILSLKYSNKDREFSSSKTNTSTNDTRISSAIQLINKMKNTDLCDTIIKMELLSEALIQLAYYKPASVKDKQTEFSIPPSYKLTKIRKYSNVLLPTCNLQVSKSNSYQNLIGIDSFGDTYKNVGGVTAPKRITCRGTDGKVRTQLLKGQDDLRQDAVMQQVFTIINNLLYSNKNTKNLRVRTYKIVPLSMRSGILEWVHNSMPIGEYLVGDNENNVGAHVMYRPTDIKPRECRVRFSKCAHSGVEEKLQVYNRICEKFKPVFHKFFEYTFPQPSVWYERHRAYIYSVATSSMCGYILGIGDRHVQNILIDKSTAEVIHIDFGIAFEQGRCLPTPETVPFRLSRDIIDGMGVCGLDGIFKKSCEKTLEVMRHNSQTILTIVEVLLYDPLYTWAVTTSEANKRQKRGQDEIDSELNATSSTENISINITAERALMRLKSKLLGTEDGYPVSLEHQVGTLIQQAQDPMNLCRLYHGWQPYL